MVPARVGLGVSVGVSVVLALALLTGCASEQASAPAGATVVDPQWRQAVLETVPADLRSVVVAHTGAIRDLLKLTRPQSKLPAWRIVAPPPPAELVGYPGTWAAYGRGDIDDPRDAVMAAGRYLRASGAPGDMRQALLAYNRSEAYVRAITVHAVRADPRTSRGYWHWQVYYRTVDGDRLLPVGYDGTV